MQGTQRKDEEVGAGEGIKWKGGVFHIPVPLTFAFLHFCLIDPHLYEYWVFICEGGRLMKFCVSIQSTFKKCICYKTQKYKVGM